MEVTKLANGTTNVSYTAESDITVVAVGGGAGMSASHGMRTSITSDGEILINDTFAAGVDNGTGFVRFAVIKLKEGQSVTCTHSTSNNSGGAAAIYAIKTQI